MSPLMLYFLAVIWAPVLEEVMFRGALLHHLRRRHRWVVAAGAASLLFALVHPQSLTFVPVLGSGAMVLAAVREWRGSIVAPIVAHAMQNLIAVTTLLLVAT